MAFVNEKTRAFGDSAGKYFFKLASAQKFAGEANFFSTLASAQKFICESNFARGSHKK